MSKELMHDLLDSFQRYGWEIEYRDVESFEELFVSDKDDVVRWELFRHSKRGTVRIQLEFDLFGDLGNSSADLNDIFYCLLPSQGHKLLFAKRNTDEWHINLKEFIDEANQISPT
jgi:hypothetical protein